MAFQCDRCKSTFAKAQGLARHAARKTPCGVLAPNGAENQCQQCGRTYASLGNLNKHIRTSCKVVEPTITVEEKLARMQAHIESLERTFAARRGGAPILPVSENDATFCIPIQWNAKSGIVFAYRFVPQFFAVICNLGRSKEHQWANVNANNVTNIVNIAIHRDFIFKENEELKGTNPILRIGKTMPFLQSNTFNSQFQRN
jgi:hypothetical protein